MDYIDAFLGRNGLLPHGICISSAPVLLWSMVVADALIALAYFSIPVAIVRFVQQRPDLKVRGLAWLFSAFIFACGLTHALHIWTLWVPDYAWLTLAKQATAGLSIATAVFTWRLIPKALAIPTPATHRGTVDHLQAEMAQRRSAEEQLAELQQSLAVTLASIDAAFMATDAEGRVTRMNRVAEQILGWSESDARGRSIWDVFLREGRPAELLTRNPLDVLAERGQGAEVVHPVTAIARDGRRTPVEVHAALTHGDDGGVRGMALVFRDQTRKMLAEAESARLAAIVESSSDAIIGKTLDGRITSWNRGAQQLFGYEAHEVLGQPVQLLIPPEFQADEMKILAQLADGVAVPAFDTLRRARDGTLRQVSLSISPIRNSHGQIIGASKIVRDISPQRRAEDALRESDARLRFTLDAAQIGEWSMDLETGDVERSLQHDRCFGYAKLQPLWNRQLFMQHLHPDDREETQRQVEQTLAALGEYAVDFRVIWPDGSTHWLRANGSVRHEGGRPKRLLGIISDITRQKEDEAARLTAQRLEAENRQILVASRLKSQFLANMSHELRTPLNAIIGFAELLHGGVVAPTSPKHREYLGHIGTSGRHLLQLINDVLDLSKVESGKLEFVPEPIDLPRLVAEVFSVLQTGAQRKRIQLGSEIDQGLDDLVLDPARLKQVLYNYLANAIKFTPEGGLVTVRARPEGARGWRLEVQDTGIGIAPADLPRLFNDFQQLDAGYSKAHQGTGLGLALTRRLVEAQGGSVGVSSTLGVGSIFHLVLDRVPSVSLSAQDGTADTESGRLLVVQADPRQQRRLVSALISAGFQVDSAASADEALRQARAQAYQAVTLDLVLPDDQGLQMLDRMRDQGSHHNLPVVGVSLHAGHEDSGHATFAVSDVLFKPLRTDQVASVLGCYKDRQPEAARVLVIDDDPLALSLMQATLAGLGITALCASDGREALAELDGHRPDAIVLDLMMPGFDGFAVLDALQALPRWRSVPVYVWTSMLLTDDELQLLRRSARAILLKGGGGLQPLLDMLGQRRVLSALPGKAV